jgi:hypothetical protein
MARIHPTTPLQAPLTSGDFRERDVLRILRDGLPANFDVFHNLAWSSMHQGNQHFGEFDLVIVSPVGHILLIEVKAGSVQETMQSLTKTYGGINNEKDIGQQVRRQHSSLLERMSHGDLPKVHVGSLLVLPDYAVKSAVLAYPRERVVDAGDMPTLCHRVLSTFPSTETSIVTSQLVVDFFSNRFAVVPDVSNNIDQVVQASTHLASGLAEWVPKISHNSNLFVIDATAGSGKTQLALSLLQSAAKQKQSACYVCFNRPLADHLTKLAPSSVEVTTFHQLCHDWFERKGNQLDFTDTDIFQRMTKEYIEDCNKFTNSLDLLVIDESQDFEPSWANAIIKKLKNNGKLYVMGDSDQQLYSRESFDLQDAVHIRCMDNFRSPRKVVHTINTLGLSQESVVARSAFVGETPHFYTWAPGAVNSLTALNRCLKQLWDDGYKPEQVAVVSFHGLKRSEALTQETLGGFKTKRFSDFDASGNTLWTDGALLVESVYRFKGQSMPVVVLCEVDFEELTDKEKHKLFVGLTRGQVRVDVVIKEESAKQLEQLFIN